MTDAEAMARGIADKCIDGNWKFKDYLIGEIAAALREADAAGFARGVEEAEKIGMEAVLKTSCVKDSHCQSVAEVFAQAIRNRQSGKTNEKEK